MIVRRARPDERPATLARLFAGRSADPAAAAAAVIGDAAVSLDRLLVAVDRDRIVGGQLTVHQNDRSAMFWPPAADSPAAADVLLAAAVRQADAAGVRVGQCLRQPGHDDGPRLTAAGFEHITDLVYLSCALAGRRGGREPTTAWIDADGDRWAALFERASDGSRDVPEADGLRTGAETLAGWRSDAGFDADLWRRWGNDGLALALRQSALAACEIAYLGVVAGRRGSGLGRRLLDDLLSRCEATGAASAFVSCDARNGPAWNLYRSAGFETEDRQELWLRLR